MKPMDRSFRCLAAFLIVAGCCAPALRAAGETELKDETGKTIVRYVVEAPANVAPAGTTDPARQVGVIFCFQEHGNPPGTDIFPVRESLQRLGLSDDYVLLAAHSQDPAGKTGARGSRRDPEAAGLGGENLSHQSPPHLYVWQRRGRLRLPANSPSCIPISSPPPSLTVGAGGPCPPSWISPSMR